MGLAAAYLSALPPRLLAAGLVCGESYELDLEDLTGTSEIEGIGDRTDVVWVEQLSAFPQGQGIGRRVMTTALDLADEMRVELMLNPWAQEWAAETGGLPQLRLVAWYNRLGFSWVASEDYHVLRRTPR